ncbi:MAG: SpoIIE family protein phosphatase [Phycisphaerales bacterium]|nr:MAG: SpoIIE family protein phosphatase [Phycisphaerales bacterium]
MNASSTFAAQAVLDSVSDGLYVTDVSREIIYWNDAAERMTGWSAADIIGKRCYDDVLCHVDKDGHRLCGEEFCPLHRAIVTGQSSTVPFVVFARHKNKSERVPLRVSVAPVRARSGKVIGGVETFRDASHEVRDINRAKAIQSLSLQRELPQDPRVRFRVQYIPHDVIGGDYYAVAPLDSDRYGFLLADVTGHGVPAALYTMFLRSLWESTNALLTEPGEFARSMNEHLCHLIREAEPFAAGVCGVLDLTNKRLRLVGAGNPSPFLIRADGVWQHLDAAGFPFGMLGEADYEEHVVEVSSGDCLLFYSDGAVEIRTPAGSLLGVEGLEKVLKALGYPLAEVELAAVEQELLACSDCIRLEDDLTLFEIRIS